MDAQEKAIRRIHESMKLPDFKLTKRVAARFEQNFSYMSWDRKPAEKKEQEQKKSRTTGM